MLRKEALSLTDRPGSEERALRRARLGGTNATVPRAWNVVAKAKALIKIVEAMLVPRPGILHVETD